MARETAAQKRTRISMLLADYANRAADLRKQAKIVDGLKEQIRTEVAPGTYNDWAMSFGTPREILDQPAARKLITDLGAEVPMKTTDAPIVVTAVVK